MLSGLKVDTIEPVLVKGKPKKEDYEKLDILINEIYNKHKSINLV